jgi:probable HAF family extracellular repeat protein
MFANRRDAFRPHADQLRDSAPIGTGRRARRTGRRQAPRLEAIEHRLLLTTIVDLGALVEAATASPNLPEGESSVAAISNSGVVVGNYSNSFVPVEETYIETNGQVTVPPPGISPAESPSQTGIDEAYDWSYIKGISDSGEVAGWYTGYQGELGDQAFVDSPGGDQVLLPAPSTFEPGTMQAYAVNDAGQATGYAFLPNGTYHAFLYSNGTTTDLGAPSGFTDSQAFAINNAGQVVGNAFNTVTGITQWFLDSKGTMTSLPNGGFDNTGANAINNAGQVVGDGEVASTSQVDALLYSNGQVKNLGTSAGFLDSEAYGINDHAQVVGDEWNPKTGAEDAFLYEAGKMIDLNSLLPANSGWQLGQAIAINNEGQIVGYGLHNGNSTSFLLDLTPAAVQLTSSASPSRFGQSVTFTATVTAGQGGGTPVGTVKFEEGAKVLETATLQDGVATFTTAGLPVGVETITAAYGGDTQLAGDSVSIKQTVDRATTKVVVTSSLDPAVAGQPVTLTATVKAQAPGQGTPSGSVTFMDGTTVLGTVALTDGHASLTISNLPVGADSITAVYGKTADFAASTSKVLKEVVKAANNAKATAIDQALEATTQDDEATGELALDLIGMQPWTPSLPTRGREID